MLSKRAGAYMFHLVTNPGDSDTALTALNELSARFGTEGPSADDLASAKNRITSWTGFIKKRALSTANETGC